MRVIKGGCWVDRESQLCSEEAHEGGVGREARCLTTRRFTGCPSSELDRACSQRRSASANLDRACRLRPCTSKRGAGMRSRVQWPGARGWPYIVCVFNRKPALLFRYAEHKIA
jgi:hypothetical protein